MILIAEDAKFLSSRGHVSTYLRNPHLGGQGDLQAFGHLVIERIVEVVFCRVILARVIRMTRAR